MRIGSLFSGIGGLELGLEWAGIGRTIWQAEQDPYCLQILEKHWPNVKRYTDVKTIGSHNLEPVDLICGGFPCQDVSGAGKGAGLSGSRSGLWCEFLRIVCELRPSWVVVENVASGAKRWVDAVRGNLEWQGYATFPVPLSALDVGAPHLRKRVFLVAYSNTARWHGWTGSGSELSRGAEPTDGSNVPHTTGERLQRPKRSRVHSKGRVQKPTDPGWWAVEPDVGRVANGVPRRVGRIKALGNAVVPQCAQVVGEFINILRHNHA